MKLAEYIYRMLLRLYPAKHRQAYEGPMLQHARDLGRAARQRGHWHVAMLCLRLLKDGIVNATIEHMEGTKMASNRYQPNPWLTVILASCPGLLIALSRRHAALLAPLLPILGYAYLGLLVLALPIIWWRRRRFPVWALLPAGALIWFLIFKAGMKLSRQVSLLPILYLRGARAEIWIALIQLVMSAAIFVAVLHRQRIPGSIWLVIGTIVFGNVILASLYSLVRYGGASLFRGVVRYFTTSGVGPVEGLMLVAVGLLAARQHGVLALLFLVGGYSYMCTDSDYLVGYRLREWTGLPAYLIAATSMYLVVGPVVLLRAKTRLGRALAVFVPVVAFHVARLVIPSLVIRQPLGARSGDVILSINAVLSFILAWVLYSHIEEASRDARPDGGLEASPLPTGERPSITTPSDVTVP